MGIWKPQRNVVLFGSQYDPIVSAYLAKCNPKPTGQWLISFIKLIKTFRQFGITNYKDRLFIFAAQNQQNARISVFNPNSTQITEVNSPTWTQYKGYTGNGTTQYLQTGFVPSVNGVNFTLNSAMTAHYTPTQIFNTSMDYGVSDGSEQVYMCPRQADGHSHTAFNDNTDSLLTISAANACEHSYQERVSSTAHKEYWFNTSASLKTNATHTVSSIALPSKEIYVCARNNNGTASAFTTRRIAYFGLGSSSVDRVNFVTAMNTFLTEIGGL